MGRRKILVRGSDLFWTLFPNMIQPGVVNFSDYNHISPNNIPQPASTRGEGTFSNTLYPSKVHLIRQKAPFSSKRRTTTFNKSWIFTKADYRSVLAQDQHTSETGSLWISVKTSQPGMVTRLESGNNSSEDNTTVNLIFISRMNPKIWTTKAHFFAWNKNEIISLDHIKKKSKTWIKGMQTIFIDNKRLGYWKDKITIENLGWVKSRKNQSLCKRILDGIHPFRR